MRDFRDEGFSLIEALVALMILGAVASTAITVFAVNDRRSAREASMVRAVIAAETLLARMGLDIALQEEPIVGSLEDGARYRLIFEDYGREADGSPMRVGLIKMTAEVTPVYEGARPIALSTLRSTTTGRWLGE